MSHSVHSIEMIRRLVAMDTTSRNSNLALIGFIADHLAGLGIEHRLVHDETGRKANLYATLGPADKPGIALSGHTDVVPIDGQAWSTDPWDLSERDGRLFGRGTADMKAFLGVLLVKAPEMLRRQPRTPIHLVFTYDEEVGCIGVRRMIDDILARGIKPLGCIVGEPTGMELVVAHKGKKSWRCRVRGREAHSSLTPLGVNAVQIACEIVTYLTNMARAFRDQGEYDDGYDVPFTTVHTGVIRGGTALNIVPRDCHFDFEIRYLPFDDPDELFAEVEAYARRFLPEMHKVDAASYIAFDALSAMPGFDTHGESGIATLGRSLSGTDDHGKVSFGTEAGLFHNAGVPAIICGPGHIAQAHQPNEWVAIDQLQRCEAFMRRLADRIAPA